MNIKAVIIKVGLLAFILIIVYDILDTLSYVFTGRGLYDQLGGGPQSPFVVSVAEQLGGASPWLFWLAVAVSVLILSVLLCAVILYMIGGKK